MALPPAIPESKDEFFMTAVQWTLYEGEDALRLDLSVNLPTQRVGTVRDTPRFKDALFIYEAYWTRLAINSAEVWADSDYDSTADADIFPDEEEINGKPITKWFEKLYERMATEDYQGRKRLLTPIGFDGYGHPIGASLSAWGPTLLSIGGEYTDIRGRNYEASWATEIINDTMEDLEQRRTPLAWEPLSPYDPTENANIKPPSDYQYRYPVPLSKDILLPLYNYLGQLKKTRNSMYVDIQDKEMDIEYEKWVNGDWEQQPPIHSTPGADRRMAYATWNNNVLSGGERYTTLKLTYKLRLPSYDDGYRFLEGSELTLYAVVKIQFLTNDQTTSFNVGVVSLGSITLPIENEQPIEITKEIFPIAECENFSGVSTNISNIFNPHSSGTFEARIAVSLPFLVDLNLYHTQFSCSVPTWRYTPPSTRSVRSIGDISDWDKAVIYDVNNLNSSIIEFPTWYQNHIVTGVRGFANQSEAAGRASYNAWPNINTAILPMTLESLGSYAFYDCSNLEHIVFKGPKPTLEPDAVDVFTGVHGNCKVEILAERRETWEAELSAGEWILANGEHIAVELYSPMWIWRFECGDHGHFEEFPSSAFVEFNVPDGETMVPPQIVADQDFTFLSWQPQVPAVANSSIVFTAQYKAVEVFTWTFLAGDHGTFAGGVTTVTIEVRDDEPIPELPTIIAAEGYDFTEWYPTPPQVPTEDLTFTAQYQIQSFVWTFNAGSHGTIDGQTSVSFTREYGTDSSTFVPSPSPDETYFFIGWDKPVPATVASDMEFTAQYSYENITWIYEDITDGVWPNTARIVGFTVNPDAEPFTELTIPAQVPKTNEPGVLVPVSEVKFATTGDKGTTQITALGLTSITMSSGIRRIGSSAFYGCSTVRSFSIPDTVVEVLKDAFYGVNSRARETISVGSSVGGWGSVTCVDGWIISSSHRGLSTYFQLIDSRVRGIADWAFANTKNYITALNFRSYSGDESPLNGISGFAFSEAQNLEDVSLPSTIQYIGEGAFSLCGNLNRMNALGNSLFHIGTMAFNNTQILSLDIPMSVTSMGENILAKNEWTTPGNIMLPARFGLSVIDGQDRFYGSVTLKAGVGNSAIKANACKGYTRLTSVTITEGVTNIGANAFEGCTELSSVSIPNSTTAMGASVFIGCTNLEKVNIGSGLLEVLPSQFYGCTALTSFSVDSNNLTYTHSTDHLLLLSKTGATFDTVAVGLVPLSGEYANEAVVPLGITTIGERAFAYRGTVHKVSCASGVALNQIKESAFEKCTALTEISLEWSSSAGTSIKQQAFDGCSNLNKVVFVGAGYPLSLGKWAFRNCTNLGAYNPITAGGRSDRPYIDFLANKPNIVFDTDDTNEYGVFEGSLHYVYAIEEGLQKISGKVLGMPNNTTAPLPTRRKVSAYQSLDGRFYIYVPSVQVASYQSGMGYNASFVLSYP